MESRLAAKSELCQSPARTMAYVIRWMQQSCSIRSFDQNEHISRSLRAALQRVKATTSQLRGFNLDGLILNLLNLSHILQRF